MQENFIGLRFKLWSTLHQMEFTVDAKNQVFVVFNIFIPFMFLNEFWVRIFMTQLLICIFLLSFLGCAATFLVIYIEKYLQYSDPWIVISKVFVQVGIACLAIYTSLTRISDNKHHPTDVLAGLLLGVIIGFLFVYVVVAQFAKRNWEQRKEDEELKLPGPSVTL